LAQAVLAETTKFEILNRQLLIPRGASAGYLRCQVSEGLKTMAYLSFNENFNSGLKFTTDGSEDTEELLKKDLPLAYTWAVWEQLQSNAKSAQYSDATKKVAECSTVQSFWELYWKTVPQPSELLENKRMVRETPDGQQVIDAIMIFRENVRPEWEDATNASGGHFQFQLKPSIGGGQLDEYWNNLVLGMIGATIEPASMITGIRLVDKLSGPRAANVIRLELWFTNYDDKQAVDALRQSVEKCMATRLDGTVGQGAPKCEVKAHRR